MQFHEQGGLIKQVYFAGLPESCKLIKEEYANSIPVFIGDESPIETLKKLYVPDHRIPTSVKQESAYDDNRMDFAKSLIDSGEYKLQLPTNRSGYPNYGTFKDQLVDRIKYSRKNKFLPLTRVHVGPYNPDYKEAKKEFNNWLLTLAKAGYLDVVSIGSSQLSQSNFMEDWGDKPNGGGVPINSEQDLRDIWNAARPMLVRTYAGTRNIPQLAEIFENTINIAWHALSFWWFNEIDGRGPYSVKKNLEQHYKTLQVVAKTGKPFEPNIPHHFSFRGGDDYTYVLSAYLAAVTAKKLGIKYFILQTMLNTPKYTWGVQDLAKARALLKLVRELEDTNFTVFLQPRAGLDYFSPDLEKAKAQLASVTAMMDDIEPENNLSPDIVHVVSYCEAIKLANPDYINESIQITHFTISQYRKWKNVNGSTMYSQKEVRERTSEIYNDVRDTVKIMESKMPDLYSPTGLYKVFHKGVFAVPYLWEGREEFKQAIKWETALINGGIKVVERDGRVISPVDRINSIFLE
jgi:hypothetical protein